MAESKDGESDVSARIASHTTQIRGRIEPHRIPYFVKMNSFFLSYDRIWRLEVSKVLTEADVEVLDNIAGGLDTVNKSIVDEMTRRELAICENLASLDAATIAPMVEQIDKYYEDEISKHYRSVMSDLSTNGQSAFTEFVDREIARRSSVAVTNRLTLYTEFPDLLMSQVQSKCSGDTEAVDKAMAKLVKQLEQQHQSQTPSQSEDDPASFGTRSR